MLPYVTDSFDFRVLRQNRRVVNSDDVDRAQELEKFHCVLNDISWGTRESAKTKEEQLREEQERLEIEEWRQKNTGGGLFNTISSGLKFGEHGKGAAGPTETGSVDFSIGNVMRCMCFTKYINFTTFTSALIASTAGSRTLTGDS